MPDRSELLSLLKSHFGFDGFRPLQEEIVGSVLEGRDTLVLMPTGGGKSLCYQLPALCFTGVTLVVSPLIALMKDQVDALKVNGVPAELINSTQTLADTERTQDRARRGEVKILYLAPERLALLGFRQFLRSLRVSLIAVDEAHCISEWGHDFRPAYRDLNDLREDFPQAPVMALTATATPQVRDDIATQLGLEGAATYVSSFNRPNLTYSVRPKDTAFSSLLSLLREQPGEPAIVYCFSRKDTESLARDLSANGVQALPYHAGLEPSVRQQTQDKFIRDQVPIIVATIAFGMGIDKPDIRLVVHYNLPRSVEGYYQETGRAGRDGLAAHCVLFYSAGDASKYQFFIDKIEDAQERENARRKLAQVAEFCGLPTCRRKYLLEYFGEMYGEGGCGACDVCLTPREEYDATEIAQKVLSAVGRTEQRFGATHVCEVLLGRKTAKIAKQGHDTLSVYGIVRDFKLDQLKDVVGQLVSRGLLVKTEDRYGTLSVSPSGRIFLQNKGTLRLARPQGTVAGTRDAPRSPPRSDDALFQRLRALRTRLAEEARVPPYVVFSDASLAEMSRHLPRDRDSLLRIRGVGEIKLERFGNDFLAEIRAYCDETGLTDARAAIPEKVEAPRRRSGSSSRSPSGSIEATGELLAQKLTLEEIAGRRGFAHSTIMSHLDQLHARGESVDVVHLLPSQERVARIIAAFRSEGNLVLLTPVRNLLGEDYSYDELRLVRIYALQTGSFEG